MILGLDISTSITGATVLDLNGKCVYNEFWDTRNKNKFATHFDKARFVKQKLEDIKSRFDIVAVYVEKPFMFFTCFFGYISALISLGVLKVVRNWKFEQGVSEIATF